jgi:hypothetical protein
MHIQKGKVQNLILVENRDYLSNQVTFEVNMIKSVLSENDKFLMTAIPDTIGQSAPLGLYG